MQAINLSSTQSIRYHYWIYDAVPDSELDFFDEPETGFIYSGFLRLYKGSVKIKKNLFTDKVRGYIQSNFKFRRDRVITIADDKETGDFAVAILHPKDEQNRAWRKVLGRTIATGRLLKQQKQNGGNVNEY